MKRLIDGNDLASLLRTRRAMDGNPTAQDAFEVALNDAANAEEITLNTLRDEVYEDAVKHGLWDADVTYPLDDCCELINDELKELAESADDYEYKQESMNGFVEELADVIIVCMSIAGLHCIDIDAAVRMKIEINKTRSWKHEGEKHEG